MSGAEMALSGYLLNAAWQIPLLFAAGWAASLLARPAGPQMQHRVWVGTFALQVMLPLAPSRDWLMGRALAWLTWWRGGVADGGSVTTSFGAGATRDAAMLHMNAALGRGIAVAWAMSVVYFAARLSWMLWKTSVLRRGARRLEGLAEADVEVAVSGAVESPATIGFRRKVLLVPSYFLERVQATDQAAVLEHERAHMARNDFAKNLLYECAALPLMWHPVVWMTLGRIGETRELVCDEAAARRCDRQAYARALLRLASLVSERPPARTLHAIGIFDANIFERRVMYLTQFRNQLGGRTRAAVATGCLLLGLGAGTSAVALRVGLQPAEQDAGARHVDVKASVMAEQVLHRVMPAYPVEAKANKDTVDGTVTLAVTIGTDGKVEHIDVQKSLRADYDTSALDAVRQWTWKPYLLNGQPVTVDTTVNVWYNIGK